MRDRVVSAIMRENRSSSLDCTGVRQKKLGTTNDAMIHLSLRPLSQNRFTPFLASQEIASTKLLMQMFIFISQEV
jgi:hypothetical protein